MKHRDVRRILVTLAAISVVVAGSASAHACLFYGIPC